MTKALVIGCGDPRMDAQIPHVKSIVRTDEVVEYRFPAPDGMFNNPERAEEMPSQIKAIQAFLKKAGPFDALAILGHTDCKEHAVLPERQRKDIQLTAMQLRDRLNSPLPVQAVLAIRVEDDDGWVLEDWGRF